MTRLALLLAALLAVSFPAAAGERPTLAIGYLALEEDSRYGPGRVYGRIVLRERPSPRVAAQAALAESGALADAVGLSFRLEVAEASDADELVARARRMAADGVGVFLLDAPGASVSEVAAATRTLGVLLINVSAEEDRLRGEACQPHLLHTPPSVAMRMDALVQHLAAKGWRDLLVLVGPLPEDTAAAATLERSASRFGARIIATRPFELGRDPRRRDQNNVALLTAEPDHDVVVVLDSDGEFGRYVPFQTNRPRPVVGDVGLTAAAWSWYFERYGAPQVNSRFESFAGRRMTEHDWAVWIGAKAIVQAAARTRSTDPSEIAAFLKSDRLRLDGSKGKALSFRAWDGQLRQPVLLKAENAVVAVAPLAGFLHERDTLDTLGPDGHESLCRDGVERRTAPSSGGGAAPIAQ